MRDARDLKPSLYTTFQAGATVYVEVTLEESSDGGATYTAKSVASSDITARFRALKRPTVPTSAGYIIDAAMTEVDAANGVVGYYATFSAAYGQVECQIVVVDAGTANATTTTGYRETLWKRWNAEVVEGVLAS